MDSAFRPIFESASIGHFGEIQGPRDLTPIGFRDPHGNIFDRGGDRLPLPNTPFFGDELPGKFAEILRERKPTGGHY